jgi:hypothetical protein
MYKDITATFLDSIPHDSFEARKYLFVAEEREFYIVRRNLDPIHKDEINEDDYIYPFPANDHRLFISFRENGELLGIGGITRDGVIWVLWKNGALKKRSVRSFLLRGGARRLLNFTWDWNKKQPPWKRVGSFYNRIPAPKEAWSSPQLKWLGLHLGAHIYRVEDIFSKKTFINFYFDADNINKGGA